MLTPAQILDALQFDLPAGIDAIHSAGAPRYVMTYQFAGGVEPGDFNEVTGTDFTGWSDWGDVEKAAFRAALDHIETVVNIDFQEVTGFADPDMNVGRVDIPGFTVGIGGFGYSYGSAGIVRYDTFAVFDRTHDLTDAADLYLHEVGHALGLKHPFSGSPTLPAAYDTEKYTVMSYTANPDTGAPSTVLQVFDILALQQRWGAAAYNTGDTAYDGPRDGPLDSIWDTGGVDMLNGAGRANAVRLDLREGFFSRFGTADDVVIAFGVTIENAAGSAFGDRITGNAARNALDGNGSNDVIDGKGGRDRIVGGSGDDRLIGGKGRDVLSGGAGGDTFVFDARGGSDTIRDFEDGPDSILLRGHGLADADAALARASETAAGVTFAFDDGSVLRVLGTTVLAIGDNILV